MGKKKKQLFMIIYTVLIRSFCEKEERSPALIHYLGDYKVSKPAPHGNSLKQTKLFL